MSKNNLLCKVFVTVFFFLLVSWIAGLYPGIDKSGSEIQKNEPKVNSPTTTPVAEAAAPVNMRVLIKNQENYYHDTITLVSDGEWTLDDKVVAAGEAVELTMASGEFNGDEAVTVTAPAGIQVTSIERASGIPTYPGNMKLYRGTTGLLMVNEVDMETYLQYVVPSEMPAEYEMEALKAQAVCARTYAYRNMLDKSLEEYHADVDDSIEFQVYNNLAPQERSNQAIAETAGEILMCDGEPITAYFFSTSCGHTSTDEVWNSNAGQSYLKSIYMMEGEERSLETEEAFSAFISNNTEKTYEQQEKWYRWQVTLPIAYLNGRMQEKNASLGTCVSIEVRKRSSGGAVEELLITGSEQTLLINNEYDIREFLAPGDNVIYTNDGGDTIISGLLPSAYFICTPQQAEDGQLTGFLLTGGGYGHGVGLSQNGANNLAKNSKSYSEILNFFYQNIQLERLQD